MSNEFKGLAAHSAEYFGDHRDHWWREGFLRSAALEWGAERIRSVLDVGCGIGHWGRLLSRVLPPDARITGIDREALWVEKATERAAALGLGDRFSYRAATAETLPFEDGSFDMVTCQTVLMHTAAPERALAEMIRVTRPGGLVVAAEPTNFVSVVLDAVALDEAPEIAADLLRFYLLCLRGKRALGLGNDNLGERLPALFAAAGLRELQVRLNDRPATVIPPYETDAERAFVEDAIDMSDRGIAVWPLDETRRYFLAGGGQEADFEPLWTSAMGVRHRVAAALRGRTFASAGGMLFYLVWGKKP